MKRGFVRESPRASTSSQVEALTAAGVDVGAIYYQEQEGAEACIASLRAGDELVVSSLDRLAPDRRTLRRLLDAVHSKGAIVVEARSKRRSDDHDSLIGMIFDAVDGLAGDRKALPPDKAREYGAKGGKARSRKAASQRMGVAEARAIWRRNSDWTNGQCVAEMQGWTVRMAYRKLGKRGLAKGRPREKKPKKQ